MNVAILGRSQRLYRSAETVVEHGHEVQIIVTSEAEPHYERTVKDFEALAKELEAEFIETTWLNTEEMEQRLRDLSCDVAVSANWQTLIQEQILTVFPHGVLNCHAGDLPRYRGNAAPNWAILADEDQVVYTIHRMNKELDAGPILLQRAMPLTDKTQIGEVYSFGERNVPDMFATVLDGLEDGSITPREQPNDPEKSLRCYPRKPQDSYIDWERSADHLDRVVRASSEPLFGAYTYLNAEKFLVWRAHPEESESPFHGTPGQVAQRRPDEEEVSVITGDGLLVLEEVQLEGSERTAATDVITSNRTRLGLPPDRMFDHLQERIDNLEETVEWLKSNRG